MLQSKTLNLFSTSRAIRNALEGLKEKNQLLPKFMTIGEFEKKAILVKGRVFIDDDTRVILLQKACDFSKFKKLNIPLEFLSFLKNSKFIFSFLDELAQEFVDLKELQKYDIYQNFYEHIEILKEVKSNYLKLLDENNFVDKMLLPSLFEVNENFVKSFEKINLYLDGYQTKFEKKLFSKISKLTTLNVIKPTVKKNTPNITVESFSLSHLQISFIKQKVYEFLKMGIKAQNIAIVLPDKSFGEEIKIYDEENNFNLAFGYSYTNTKLYKILNTLYQYLSENSLQNIYRYKRYFQSKFKEDEDFFSSFEKFIKDDIDEIYEEEKYLFLKLLPYLKNYSFSKKLHLFLNRLSKRSIDDVKGGKITILEILETRGVEFEAIIIPNFNEDQVPKKIKKDMFISSNLRKMVNLPTLKDREKLQKKLYQNIIQKAKEVAICYVEDEQNSKSRFLDELGFGYREVKKDPLKYLNLLLPKSSQNRSTTKAIKLEYDFTKVELSASRLKTFLECKRKYYYKYIKNLKEADIPTNEISSKDVGDLVHQGLFELYQKKPSYFDKDELLIDLRGILYQKSQKNTILKFYIDLWLERFANFASQEVKRFEDGFRIFALEKSLAIDYKGLKLIGKLDRIDIKDELLYVIDYKSGKVPKTTKNAIKNKSVTDFQLQFYFLLSSSLKQTANASFYDLTNAKILDDDFFDEKLELLDEILLSIKEQKEIDFSLCEDKKICKFCPYVLICGRE